VVNDKCLRTLPAFISVDAQLPQTYTHTAPTGFEANPGRHPPPCPILHPTNPFSSGGGDGLASPPPLFHVLHPVRSRSSLHLRQSRRSLLHTPRRQVALNQRIDSIHAARRPNSSSDRPPHRHNVSSIPPPPSRYIATN
jgi:hypothetical protein